MRHTTHRRLTSRLAGAAAAAGLVLTGLVATAGPASAAECSGTSGVTVVVDTGSSTSIRCASGDPSSAWAALTATGHSVTPVQQFPGAICRIDGYPSSDPCRQMPPADAYWAFFHAPRGGSWTYSSTGATSHDPAPGTVVGFRFGSGQQPRTAPPAKTAASTPKPSPATSTRTTTPRTNTTPPRASVTPRPAASQGTSSTIRSAAPSGSPSVTASTSPTATAGASAVPSASASDTATTVAAAPTSADVSGGAGALVAGVALVALVAGGAGWAAWRRRT